MDKNYEGYLKTQRKYPTVIVDNFFKNPDIIREFALSLPYERNKKGTWPDRRSPLLHEVNEPFVKSMAKKILSVYFDLRSNEVFWDSIQMGFQRTKEFSSIKDSLQNKGWIHIDGRRTFAGLIYLTPNISMDAGTTIYRLKEDYKDFNVEDKQLEREHLYGDGVYNKDTYDKEINELYKKFEVVTEVKNIYNRCIMYDGHEYHTASTYHSKGQERLILIYFFTNVRCNLIPFDRIMNFDNEIEDTLIN